MIDKVITVLVTDLKLQVSLLLLLLLLLLLYQHTCKPSIKLKQKLFYK